MVLEPCSVLSFLSLIACYRSIAFQGNFTLLLSGLSTSVGENNGADDGGTLVSVPAAGIETSML